MEFTEQQLKRVETLAENLTPIVEIAIKIDVPLPKLEAEMDLSKSPFYKAYMRGKSKTASMLRERILECANAGSPSSIIEALHQLDNME